MSVSAASVALNRFFLDKCVGIGDEQAIKPDGVQRQVVGEVITRFEKKGYKLVAMKVRSICMSAMW